LRVSILLLPVVVAVGFTWLVGRLLSPGRLGFNRWVWIGLVFVLANFLLAGLRQVTRRLTPLVALMKLTLVFPDHAPSRTKATLRKSNSRTLLRQMEEARARGDTTGEAVHGDYLVQMLKEINDHDRLTRGHSERVRAYSEMLGEELGLGEDDMNKLRWSALLHDVGKLEVPYEILNKDGRPTSDEWLVLSNHPTAGGRRLEPLRPWLGEWVHSADQHHCRWDGEGYPEKLAGTDIAFSGRLVAVADAYDVMTSPRSYKKPLAPEIARQELTDCAGSQFDPAMVRAFLNIGLGRLRTVAGPLAWLANLVGSAQVPVPVATAVTAAGGSAVVATAGLAIAAVGGLMPTAESAALPIERVVIEEPAVVADDLEITGIEDESIVVVLAAEGGEGEIAFRLGAPAHGDGVLTTRSAPVVAANDPASGNRWVVTATYTPNQQFFGEDEFTYQACDATGLCGVGQVRVIIVSVNDAPRAIDDRSSVPSGESIRLDVLANDTDADGDVLSIDVLRGPAHGQVDVVGRALVYTPDDGFVGRDEIEYVVSDPDGSTSVATVIVEVGPASDDPPPTTTLPPVANDSPTAVDDLGTLNEDESVLIDVLANDSDPQDDSLSISAVDTPLHGVATVEAGQIRYTPDQNFWGSDQFSYHVNDGGNRDAVAVVLVTVDPVNDPPVAADDVAVTVEDTPVSIAIAGNDSDPEGGALDLTVPASSVAGGALVSTAGAVTYSPPLDYSGLDSFSYTVTDPGGLTSAVATVTITVTAVNDAPAAADDSGVGFTTVEDIPFTTGDVTANDSDADDPIDPGSIALVVGPANGGLVSNDDGSFDYIPNSNFFGFDSFSYTIADTEPLTSNVATVTITVTAVNDAPVVADDSGVGFTTVEDVPFTTGDLTGNDSDVDDPIGPGSIALVLGPANGGLVSNGDGSFDYTPNAGFIGSDSFTYTIADAEPLTSNAATVTITVAENIGVVISEFSNVGGGSGGSDFIELYNASSAAIDIEGWTLEIADDAAIKQTISLTGPNTVLSPGGHYLLATVGVSDQPLVSSLDASFAARIFNGLTVIDTVGTRERIFGGSIPAALWSEGMGLPPLVILGGYDQSWERWNAGLYGNCRDSDDNSADFIRNFTSFQVNPQSSTDPATPCGSPTAPVASTHLVISEYRTDGPNGGGDELVEIFNPTSSAISLDGYQLRKTGGSVEYSFPNVMLAPGQHYLTGGSSYPGAVDDTHGGFTNGDGVELYDPGGGFVVDALDVGDAPPNLPKLDGRVEQTYERKFGGCQDTDVWLDDFFHQTLPTPSTSSDAFTPC
jgi:hypothetical protein